MTRKEHIEENNVNGSTQHDLPRSSPQSRSATKAWDQNARTDLLSRKSEGGSRLRQLSSTATSVSCGGVERGIAPTRRAKENLTKVLSPFWPPPSDTLQRTRDPVKTPPTHVDHEKIDGSIEVPCLWASLLAVTNRFRRIIDCNVVYTVGVKSNSL